MMEFPALSNLTETDKQALTLWAAQYKQTVLDSLKPKPDALGLRQLPREPGNPNKFLSQFKTDKHTYTLIGDAGIGFERYTMFQKRSLQRGFARDFQQVWDTLQQIKLGIAGETAVAKLRSEAIIAITALQDSVADFGREQFDAALWLCTLFVLREDETMSTYSEQVAEEKLADWAAYGYSELDFFFLSGNLVPGYGSRFREVIKSNERARQKLLDVIATHGKADGESSD